MRPEHLRRAYARHKRRAGGAWHARVSAGGAVVVEDDDEAVVEGYSVQKVALAGALLAKADRGELALDRRVRLERSDVLGGCGVYHLQPSHGDELTVAGVLTALVVASDNTAVRLCGRLVPGPEVNEILAGLGLVHTRVVPAPNPARFFLGTTTARETHDLLARLAAGALLSPAGTDFLLALLRAPAGYHDGVRRDLSGPQRARVASKHGADRDARGAARHEAGVVFGPDGAPTAVYALFADALGAAGDYGPTHPAVRAHAALGRILIESC